MPSSFSNMLNDYFYGVIGILRKRSHHRAKKRGEDFRLYEEKIKDEQRKVGKPLFEERLKLELKKPSLFSLIDKDPTWNGSSFVVPMILHWAKRKRANYRKEEL